jgi:hypothetical protein
MTDTTPMISENTAHAQHRRPSEVPEEAVRQYLDNQSWTKILGYGHRRAKELNLTEADNDRAIAETRREQRRRRLGPTPGRERS